MNRAMQREAATEFTSLITRSFARRINGKIDSKHNCTPNVTLSYLTFYNTTSVMSITVGCMCGCSCTGLPVAILTIESQCVFTK